MDTILQVVPGEQTTALSTEAAAHLELDALFGAFEDVRSDDTLDRAIAQERDRVIFAGIKQVISSAEGQQNIQLVQSLMARLSEMACNHQHFAASLEASEMASDDTMSHNEHLKSDAHDKRVCDDCRAGRLCLKR